MNQKKCPKCGELNPPEAVMCWACYTPLTGAVAGAAASGVAATTATARAQAPARAEKAHSDDEKPKIAPWQIGAVVAALLLAGGFAFMSMSGGGGEDDGGVADNGMPVRPPGGGVGSLTMPGVGAGTSDAGAGINNGTVQMPPQRPDEAPYRITTPPGRDVDWPSIGVMPGTSVSATQAAALAKAVYQQVARGRNYKGAYVYVFSDRDAATAFQNFQKTRRGAPLQGGDYSTLSEVWPKTLARYEYNNGNEDVRYPSSAPSDWWSRAGNYTKAR